MLFRAWTILGHLGMHMSTNLHGSLGRVHQLAWVTWACPPTCMGHLGVSTNIYMGHLGVSTNLHGSPGRVHQHIHGSPGRVHQLAWVTWVCPPTCMGHLGVSTNLHGSPGRVHQLTWPFALVHMYVLDTTPCICTNVLHTVCYVLRENILAFL